VVILSGVRCRLAYGPADATATHCLLLQYNADTGFTFLVPAYPGCPRKEAVKWLYSALIWYTNSKQLYFALCGITMITLSCGKCQLVYMFSSYLFFCEFIVFRILPLVFDTVGWAL